MNTGEQEQQPQRGATEPTPIFEAVVTEVTADSAAEPVAVG
ncbi:hypothetical protein [Amycolatopsis sp.]|nr:hypothetical protein [Amycolatopsis sp.]HVV13457.1 hypothetical protein [Amycolatopsis sp.]